jgi:hypothetical protein
VASRQFPPLFFRGIGALRAQYEMKWKFNENCFTQAFGGMVVRVNARGDAPPRTPHLLVTSDQGHLSLFSSRTVFWEENSFGGLRTDLAGLNSLNLYSLHVEFLRAPHIIQTKTLTLKVCCGHLACQRSGPSLPLFTQEPQTVPLVSKLGTKILCGFYTNYLGILR